ncbi:MAG TPA: dihydrodipicolinate synthase family protein [Microvirga sp.]|nr:dihydrodipicolinate synthase family protein [Microvirga sp.]
MHPTLATLRGIVPSLNTPFLADDRIDEVGIRSLVEATIEAGCVGMLVLAVAGENRSLTFQERDRIGRVIAEANAGRRPVIVNVTGPDLAGSIALSRQAAAVGADALCYQVDPRKSLAELRDEIERVAEPGPEIVVVQDLDWAGGGLPLDVIEGLVRQCPRVQAIKIETVLAGPKYSRVLRHFDGALHVSGGWAAAQMIEALTRGVHAFMPTAMDHLYVRVSDLFRAGREAEAQAVFETMLPILAFTQQHIDVSIVFLKRLRRLQGLFETDRTRCGLAFDPVQDAIAGRLAARALALDAAAARERQTLPIARPAATE